MSIKSYNKSTNGNHFSDLNDSLPMCIKSYNKWLTTHVSAKIWKEKNNIKKYKKITKKNTKKMQKFHMKIQKKYNL